MKDWKFTHPHDPMVLTMHDCFVTRIELETDGDEKHMTWHIPDGIWIAPGIPYHDIEKMCRTNEACAVFSGEYLHYEDDLSVSVCLKSRWHGQNKRLLTETWSCMSLGEFVEEFRKQGWSLEIVNTYTEGTCFYVTGEIHTPKKRWWREFRISFNAETANYYWDAIHPDRVW